MTTNEHETNDGRTEPERHESGDLDADDLIVGDRIDPALVAGSIDAIGSTTTAMAGRPDAKQTQLGRVTTIDPMEDTHSAILADGETGTLVRAGRRSGGSAMTQAESDWTVREIGDRVTVTDAEVLQEGDGEDDFETTTQAEFWANTVLGDRAAGFDEYADEVKNHGPWLTLYDPFSSRKIRAQYELESTESTTTITADGEEIEVPESEVDN